MAKKNKKKQQRKKQRLTKLSQRKFVNKICRSCGICPITVAPKFCFGSMYTENKQGFIDHAWPFLVRLSKAHRSETQSIRNVPAQRFTECFCHVCEYGKKGTCDFLPGCMLEWKDQMFSADGPIRVTKKRKKGKDKIYVEATPTFFSRDNAKWTEMMKDLTGEGSTEKQDTSSAGA